MVDRIKEVIEYAQMSTSTFADKINISRSSLTHIFSGRNQPSLDIAKKILSAFPEISTEWLIMGMGNMLQEVKPTPAPQPGHAASSQPHPQIELFADEDDTPEPPQATPVETPAPQPQVEVIEPEKETPVEQPMPEPKAELSSETPVRRPIGTVSRGRGRASESYNPPRESRRDRISNSQGDKKIVQILFIYDDKSFDVYTPNNG